MTVDRERCQTVGRYMFRLNTTLRRHQALVTNIAYIDGKCNAMGKIGIEISVEIVDIRCYRYP